jgi:asparagine synthase (glutamine-hydrolysing)
VKAFLAVSGPAATGASPAVLRWLDPQAAVALTDDGWIATSPVEPGDVDDTTGFTYRLTRSIRARGGDVPSRSLAEWLGDGSAIKGTELSGVLPPFAAAHRGGAGDPVVVAADWLGMRQLYWWQGDAVAAVSTSALALAELAGAGLDRGHLALQSLIGWQVGGGTVFTGVHKLAPASAAILKGGRVRVASYTDAVGPDESLTAAPLSTVVDEMAEILRGIHATYLTDHPQTVLQLTGGQDSRVLLAAIPPAQRPGVRALTLDVHGGIESRIAGRLAELSGLRHEIHWLDEQAPIDPATAHRLATEAARALDCMASPLALAPLVHAESFLAQGHRLSGAGGETARGFYYPGQPRGADSAPRLVERLAQWRLFANEAVDGEALEPGFAASARADAVALIQAEFDGYAKDWLRATDEFYLFGRTSRWAGATGTPASVVRHFVNPLLDRRVMQLALTPDPAAKRDSRLTGQLMRRLDPRLAAVPLDSGLVPAKLGRGGVASSVAVARVTARKAVKKVRQRLGNVRRAQLGAAEMASLVLTHWRANPELVAPIAATGLVRPQWMDEVLAGKPVAPTTVAFLVNLAIAGEVGS